MQKRLLGGAGVIGAILLQTGQAKAALMLTLSETGFAPFTVVDSGNTGSLSFIGTYGDFQTNFVAGISDKLTTPPPPGATLQVESIDVKNLSTAGVTKTLTLVLTDDGYTFPTTLGSLDKLDSAFGGTFTGATAGDTATFQSFVVAPATTTGVQSYTAPVSDPGTTSFSTNVVPVNFTQPAAYTLTNTTTISLTGAFEQSNLSGTTTVTAAVPEPVSLAAVALALPLALRRRSR
jgi:hypothetical protein